MSVFLVDNCFNLFYIIIAKELFMDKKKKFLDLFKIFIRAVIRFFLSVLQLWKLFYYLFLYFKKLFKGGD